MLCYFKREEFIDPQNNEKFVRHYFSDANYDELDQIIATTEFSINNDPIGKINGFENTKDCIVFPNLSIGLKYENSNIYEIKGVISGYSKTVPLTDFLLSLDAKTIDLIRNPKTGKRFFTVPAADCTGRVSEKIEKLSSDLFVSWFIPLEGEPSYMLHPANKEGVNYSYVRYSEKDLNQIQTDNGRQHDNIIELTKTQPLVDFLLGLGANTIDLIRNPRTNKRFFTVAAADCIGRVSEKIQKLSTDLFVSWVIALEGEASYMLHLAELHDKTLNDNNRQSNNTSKRRIKFTEKYENLLSQSSHRDLSNEELTQLTEYIWIFKEYQCKEHYEVNNIITERDRWDEFKKIRSMNDHGYDDLIRGIQPLFFALICEVLEIDGADGSPLEDYETY